jgi:DNA-binding MarR family transcriptional regulator
MSNNQNLVEEFLDSLTRIGHLVHHCSGTSLEEKLTTILQTQAIKCIYDKTDITVGEFAKHLALSSGSSAQLVERLVMSGCITKTKDGKDGRVFHLNITESGKKELIKMKKQYMDKMGKILKLIPETDLKELIRIQNNLSSKLSEKCK